MEYDVEGVKFGMMLQRKIVRLDKYARKMLCTLENGES